MSPWFAKDLGDPLVAGESLSRLEALFRAVRGEAAEPVEMAIFIRQGSEGRRPLRGAGVLFSRVGRGGARGRRRSVPSPVSRGPQPSGRLAGRVASTLPGPPGL